MPPKVSIIILNWNGKDETLECLESVYQINYENYEVILVDNGSVDDSVRDFNKRFNQLIIIENKENEGFCKGNNLGISLALERKAEYLLILNNDTLVEPSILKDLISAVRQDPERIIVNPLIAYAYNRQRIHWLGAKIDWGNAWLCGSRKEKEALSSVSLMETDSVSWCAAFFNAKAIYKTGYLDESFFAYYEDIDWSCRARKNGFKTMVFPKVLVYHKCSQSSGGEFSPTVYFYLFRNRFIFILKHGGNLRKLQFCFNYVTGAFKRNAELLKLGKFEEADSVLDGVWSALAGAFFDKKEAMPDKIKQLPIALKKIYLFYMTVRNMFFK
jgi:GT2 family glycosyltransferase